MKCSELLRKLKKAGIQTERQGKGSHIILIRKDGETFSFPDHGSKEMAKGTENAINQKMGRT